MVETEEAKDLLQVLRDLADRDAGACAGSRFPRQDLLQARDAAVTWLLDCCLEQRWPCGTFARAVGILDRFLQTCPSARCGQAQLATATCMVLAAKKSSSPASDVRSMIRALVEYADGSLLPEEIKVRTVQQNSNTVH